MKLKRPPSANRSNARQMKSLHRFSLGEVAGQQIRQIGLQGGSILGERRNRQRDYKPRSERRLRNLRVCMW